MTHERTGNDATPSRRRKVSPVEEIVDFMRGVQDRFQTFRELGELRDAQQPLMRLYRDVLLGELRATGIIHVAEQEANEVLEFDMTYFRPGDTELSSTCVHGRPIEPSKLSWGFMLHDVDYDAQDVDQMPWEEGLKFGFSRTIKQHTETEPGVWATVEMTYLPNRHLVIAGVEVTYDEKLGFHVAYDRFGLNFPYKGGLIYPKEFDLEEFRQGLRKALDNPKKYQTGPLSLRQS